MSSDWTHGYPKELLKKYASFFDEQYKPYVGIGPFTTPSKRGIAEALSRNNFTTLEQDGAITAAAVSNVMRSGSRHSDFSGRQISIQKDHLFIKDIAGVAQTCMGQLIEKLRDTLQAPVVWVQIFQEDEDAKALMGVMGFQLAIVKITAYGEIRGLYVWARDGNPHAHFPTEKFNPLDALTLSELQKGFITQDEHFLIVNELDAFAAQYWKNHYSNYNEKNTWSAFALKGYDKHDPTFIIKPAEMGAKWKEENKERLTAECVSTVAAPHFPATRNVVLRIPGNKQRVRFMRLKGGATLGRHNDNTGGDEGFNDNQIIRLHLPIRTSDAVTFHGWDMDGRHLENHLQERGLYYMDQRKPHQVTNTDLTLDRVHLVVDVHVDNNVRELFKNAIGDA